MDLSISTWMMLFFILFMIAGIWKIYAFLPNKQLEDDDKTQEASYELRRLMLKIIREKEGKLSSQELFLAITENESFDSKLFWRFNQNRLNQLLNQYFIEHPHAKSIEDIYKNNLVSTQSV
jgi:hypothetical protein